MVSHSECNICCFVGVLPENYQHSLVVSLITHNSPNILNRNLRRPSPRIWRLESRGRHRSWEPPHKESRPGGMSRRDEPENTKNIVRSFQDWTDPDPPNELRHTYIIIIREKYCEVSSLHCGQIQLQTKNKTFFHGAHFIVRPSAWWISWTMTGLDSDLKLHMKRRADCEIFICKATLMLTGLPGRISSRWGRWSSTWSFPPDRQGRPRGNTRGTAGSHWPRPRSSRTPGPGKMLVITPHQNKPLLMAPTEWPLSTCLLAYFPACILARKIHKEGATNSGTEI